MQRPHLESIHRPGLIGPRGFGYWAGADSGAAGDDDAQERYLIGECGGGIVVAVGRADGDILCSGGHLLDCADSLGRTRSWA